MGDVQLTFRRVSENLMQLDFLEISFTVIHYFSLN